MMSTRLVLLLLWMASSLQVAVAADLAAIDPSMPASPTGQPVGYPSRDPSLDVLPGFRNPPPGYGEVPFWWWTGDPLDNERLVWQIEELHKKGISGMQVNYAHEDTPGWLTYTAQPAIFSENWWATWKAVAGECGKRGMGIGLSGYTLDWPNGKSLISSTIYSDPEIQGRELAVAKRVRAETGKAAAFELPADTVAVRAYPIGASGILPGSQDLADSIQDGYLNWTPAEGSWEIWLFTAARRPGTLNPIHPLSGRRVVERFFQPFQDHAPQKSAAGLNYFFHDELQFGVGDRVWSDDLAAAFRQRKGYDLFDALPAMFQEVGPKTVKYRLDFMDVKVQLAQERYFIPIFDWHWSRGKIYGCDQGSRGRNPMEFGDYFSAVRWYTSPGHDTPGGHADLIKGKVSSSIAQLYRRPRVWLEGYHSLGWGATPENLMFATRENYLYGCNLLNLHGLYYTTHGSFWEWAPPCYHFRMPYWEHMAVFLKYFERLSYLMSQGVHRCDLAVMYPVSPGQAQLGGQAATDTAFAAGSTLFQNGYDFIFMDFDSLSRAQVRDGRLHVSDASYRVLVLPAMRAVRWSTLEKAREFYRAGGIVIAIRSLPEASDRAGSDDRVLDSAVKEIFGATAAETKAGVWPAMQKNDAGGVGLALPDPTNVHELHQGTSAKDISGSLLDAVQRLLPRDVQSDGPVKATHRKVGRRDVYLVMEAPKGARCTFRATGRPELWDPWTGEVRTMHVLTQDADRTTVRMPLEAYEARVVVFTPGESPIAVPETSLAEVTSVELAQGKVSVTGLAAEAGTQMATVQLGSRKATVQGVASTTPSPLVLEGDWECELKPTMDNRWGDFRLPATEKVIGAEARVFRYAEESQASPGWQATDFDDSRWPRVTHGFGLKFWKLGPLPKQVDTAALEAKLATLAAVDLAVPVEIDGRRFTWTPYAFSWRWGVEGDPGHQGWHGLKENVSDDFIRLGRPTGGHNETRYVDEKTGTRYYLWTAAVAPQAGRAKIVCGGEIKPAAVYLNGAVVANSASDVTLRPGFNPLLLRYDGPGRGHFVLETADVPSPETRTPLAMAWYDRPGVLALDALPGIAKPAGWYRFIAPPGLRGLSLTARGKVQGWADGQPLTVTAGETAPSGATRYRLSLASPMPHKAKVALRIEQARGCYGGEALPEPILLDCGSGTIALGDWSQGSALECYSGGVWYRKNVTLTAQQLNGRVVLDLGQVGATAEVRVNGQQAGVRVAPPWKLEITSLVTPGENRIEVLVYNTLANHYLTIPTRYRGNPTSGLLGPVRLEFLNEVTLRGDAL
jgi:hypothetical protein